MECQRGQEEWVGSRKLGSCKRQVVDGYESRGEGESDQGLLAALNLASTLTELDQLDDARQLVRSVLEVRRRTLGPDDPKSLEVQRVLAVDRCRACVTAPGTSVSG